MELRKIGKVLLYVLAGSLGLVLLLLLAVKLALDRVPQYQAEIKEWVHQRIGYHIAFAHVSPALRWYGPELSFEQLELRSKDDQRVLARAAGVRIGADLWQVLRNGRLMYGARIELDSPDVVIARIAPDRFAIASEIELGGGKSPLPDLRLDQLPAGTLAIRHGVVTIKDWSPTLPALALHEVNLALLRGERTIKLRLNAALPSVLGGVLNVDGEARGDRVSTLEWTALARTQSLAFVGWHELVPEYLSRLASGTGGFEIAARGRGADFRRADLDFSAADVKVQLTDEPAVTFDQIGGALTVTHAGENWSLLGRRVRALRGGGTQGGGSDPDSQFDVNWRGDAGLLELHAQASYLRAETLLPLAGMLPQRDLRERLQDIAPTGEWMDTHVDLSRAGADGPLAFKVHARFRGVGFGPSGRAPGLRGLDGFLAGTQDGGRVDIETQKGVFNWPAEYAQPVALEQLKTTLYWKRSPEELLVATPSIDVKTRDATLKARLAWHQPADGSSPVMTLASSVDNAVVADTRLYLPKLLISPGALAWLDQAFVTGHLSHADVVLQGPVRNYPFRDGSGLFLARAHIDGLTLNYKDGWPVAENLSLLAEFRNEGLSVQLASGHIGNLKVESGTARFADFKTGELQLHTLVSGDAADTLDYLRATPLNAAADQVFSLVDAQGPMSADVDLYLPFKEFDRRHTLVSAHLDGVSLKHHGATVSATELTGDADVDGSQVSRADVHGKALGGNFQMTARAPRNRPVTRTILVFNGTLSGEALHSALTLPAAIPIGGSTDWHGVLRMTPEPARERTLRLNSSLVGLEFNLPDPLAKPAGRALPTTVDVDWPAAGGEQIRVGLASVLRAQFKLDTGADGPSLNRVSVAFGAAPGASPDPPPFSESQVLSTGGSIGRLDLAGWLKLYTPDKSAKPVGSFLRSAQFEVAQIDYLGLSFLDVGLDLTLTDSGWRIGLGGPNVVGSILMPGAADSGTPWELEFQRLKFVDGPASTLPTAGQDTAATHDTAAEPAGAGRAAGASPGGAVPAGVGDPRNIPALDFHAAELIWGERHLGDVRAALTKLDDGISLKQLTVSAPNFAANAKGEWRGKDAGTARVEGTLSSTDVGGTMKDLGYDAVIEAKTAKLDFDMSWLGAPTGEALTMATGHVNVMLDKGQLTDIKPGAGRVLGLASLAALPRRLSLDFSDLTDKGLAFDTIRGDFDLRDGSAYTDNVIVKGPAAEIGLIGRVGLKNKDYDQTVEVTGNVPTTLPLAAFVAGPVVGGAVLLFSQVFKQPLKGLARGYYRITGNWDNPTVERVKSAEAAAATAEVPK